MAANFLVDFTDKTRDIRWLMNQDIPFIPDKFVSCTPQVSGVYRMLNQQEKVIYVGKAKVLPKRFQSYFEGNSHRPDLENHIAKIQTVFVFQDTEAYELEYNIYLKYYLPYYNKTTPECSSYLHLTPQTTYQTINPLPVFRRDIQHMKDRVDFIGPFTNTKAHNQILEEFKTVFKIPSCSPAKFKRHQKDGFVCEEARFNRCKGHCLYTNPINYQEYWQPIKEIFLHKGALGKTLFKQVATKMPVTKKFIGQRSILDTLNLDDNFDIIYWNREENLGCMSIIEVCKGQVIDIRNVFCTASTNSSSLHLNQKLLNQYSNQEIFQSFLIQYYSIVRSADYLADNEMIDHKPTKIIIINSDFTAELAKEYSIQLSQIFKYKVRLGAKSPSPKLVNLAQFNAWNACLQRWALLEVPVDCKKCQLKYPNSPWPKVI